MKQTIRMLIAVLMVTVGKSSAIHLRQEGNLSDPYQPDRGGYFMVRFNRENPQRDIYEVTTPRAPGAGNFLNFPLPHDVKSELSAQLAHPGTSVVASITWASQDPENYEKASVICYWMCQGVFNFKNPEDVERFDKLYVTINGGTMFDIKEQAE